MSYHPFTDNGHDCPECGHNVICTMEDGDCTNLGKCQDCITEDLRTLSFEEREYREMMQSEYDHMKGR